MEFSERAHLVTGLGFIGLAGVSRYILRAQSNELFGGDYNRSVFEHFSEASGLSLFFLNMIIATASTEYKNSDKLTVQIPYIIWLLFWEVVQMIDHNREFQWEQFLGSLTGIGTGFVFHFVINKLSEIGDI